MCDEAMQGTETELKPSYLQSSGGQNASYVLKR